MCQGGRIWAENAPGRGVSARHRGGRPHRPPPGRRLRPGHTVPTETLIAEVWGPEYAGEAEHVKHYVWTLRKKIEADPGDPKHLITERGFGYRFE